MKFKDMPYERPNIDKVIGYIKATKENLENSSSAEEQINLIKDFADFRKDFDTTTSIAHVRHTMNTLDEFYAKENEFFDENLPIVETNLVEVSKAIYNSKFKKELEEEFGTHYFKLLECNLVLNENAIPFMQKENELVTKYSKIIANSQIDFRGKTYTLTQMAPLLQNPDREYRKEAYKASNAFFKANLEEFDALYDELVKTRTDMAKALGYENYVDLQYKLLQRTDYDSKDVANYREKVLKTITPLAVELRKEQANRLGISDFKYFDIACDYKDGNSNPRGDYKFIVENAQKMYQELSKETGEFFDFMVENELMDLVAKPGKRSGGYCTSFDKYKSPFIFSNFNGTRGDIDVITHEAGHAFQNFMSQHQILPEYIWPTYEACEIHSMSMEFLTWPWMELFFGDEANKFKYSALKSAITFIPYGVTIDHFQHFVYENPNATPEERRNKYHELELMYEPDKDYDDDFLEMGTYWFKQGHVFSTPFYYIDYTLAQVCAFQYLLKSLENKEKALDEYITLCKAGGAESFFKLMDIGKLKNPMTTSVLEEIAPKLKEVVSGIEI
ncbi:M3 family oligoendopeptidase [Peptoniphilus stercorisuis]|uniref:M3 family oligoendopeptidase n=1 Tax=Peptoniphilus stercorisuis TaxID=1436965 RepID=A0ABS4KDB2_9FIRM|nr:M3 family oligoendopeptidase [Peptoniphilus stercorisuis]MBP2025742.1 M3 family oligoendopeptidase [Peptoniphilus stercorisuis]